MLLKPATGLAVHFEAKVLSDSTRRRSTMRSATGLGCYVQTGAMLDGAGLRIWDIPPRTFARCSRLIRRGAAFKSELAALMRAEARAVPGGRFSLLVKRGVAVAVRIAPFDD
jgi:hypothetical protein